MDGARLRRFRMDNRRFQIGDGVLITADQPLGCCLRCDQYVSYGYPGAYLDVVDPETGEARP